MNDDIRADRKRRIAKILQQARCSKDITQAQMALLVGKSPSSVGAYEQGVNTVPSDVLLIYCEVCDIEPNYLFEYSNENGEDAELLILLKKMTVAQKKALIKFLQHFI